MASHFPCGQNICIINNHPIILQAHLKFPPDYPYNPPSIRFLSKVWHPNVYEVIIQFFSHPSQTLNSQNGDLCVSILHPPVDDPQSGELPCERWNPTQNVRTILLSVVSIWGVRPECTYHHINSPQVSLLNEPNTSSPANVDASVMYRRWKDSRGKDKEYENIIRWN